MSEKHKCRHFEIVVSMHRLVFFPSLHKKTKLSLNETTKKEGCRGVVRFEYNLSSIAITGGGGGDSLRSCLKMAWENQCRPILVNRWEYYLDKRLQ